MLTAQQLAFIQDDSKRKVLLAIAGSGKTSTIQKLLENKTEADKSLLLVFNVSLREKLKHRFKDYPNVAVTNIHSLLYNALRKAYPDRVVVLVDHKQFKQYLHLQADTASEAKPNIEELYKQPWDNLQSFQKHIETLAPQVRTIIQNILTRNPAVLSYRLLEFLLFTEPQLIQDSLADFSTIIIDEIQDIPPLLLIGLIKNIPAHTSFIISGDPLQNIYSFMGTSTTLLNEIITTYQIKSFEIHETFRVPRPAVEIINNVLQTNIKSSKAGQVSIVQYKTQKQFLATLAKPLATVNEHHFSSTIKTHWQRSISEAVWNGKTIGILARHKHELNSIENTLKRFDVPFININTITHEASQLRQLLEQLMLEKISAKQLEQKLTQIQRTLLDQILDDLLGHSGTASHTGKQTLEQLLSYLDNNVNQKHSLISQMIEQVQLHALKLLGSDTTAPIILSTIHSSKGLEFDLVIMPFLNAGSIPAPYANTTQALEEEKRVLYVGLSRTKETLILGTLRDRPSPFIKEVINQLKIQSGTPGKGKVTTNIELIELATEKRPIQQSLL